MKVNHPSTNQAQHRVSSLIRLKTLSLSHAANEEVMSLCLFTNSTLASNTIAKIYYRHSTAKLLLLLLLLLLHPFNRLFSRTTSVSWYQKGKTSLDLNEARDDGVLRCSGISWTICKQSAPCSRQITTSTLHHSIFYRLDALHDTQPTVSKHSRHTAKIRHTAKTAKLSLSLTHTHTHTHTHSRFTALFPGLPR